MAPHTLTLRLIGSRTVAGEIAVDDLLALGGSLQSLTRRVGRFVVGQPGPGRTHKATDRATRLTLRAVGSGSTVLDLGMGDVDVLPLLDATGLLESATMDRLWEIFAGLETGYRPGWMTDLLSTTTIEFVDALSMTASECQVSGRSAGIPRPNLRVRPATVNRTDWSGGPSLAGIDGVDDEEVAAFLAALNQ